MVKRGQVSFEFIVVFVLVFMVFLALTMLLIKYVEQGNDYSQKKRLDTFADAIQNEIFLVYKAPGELSSKVYIPDSIDGHDFDIGLDGNILYVKMGFNKTAFRNIPNVTDTSIISKGCNVVSKTGGALDVQTC